MCCENINNDYDWLGINYVVYVCRVCQLQLQFLSRFELFLIGKVVHIMRIIILFFHAFLLFVHNLFGDREGRGQGMGRNNGKSSQTFKETKGFCSTFVRQLKKFLKDVGEDRSECNELILQTAKMEKEMKKEKELEKGLRYLHFRYSQDLGDLVEAVWGHDFNCSRDKRIF